jgi:virginiamycin B lyase
MNRIPFLLVALLLSLAAQAQTVSYFRVPDVTGGIISGPDGNLWVSTSQTITKMTPLGHRTQYPLPDGVGRAITLGPDGRIWLGSGSRLFAVTTEGGVTQFPLPAGISALSITTGSDGHLWFGYGGGVGRMTTAGEVTLFPVPGIQVHDLTTGPDGNVWFVEYPFTRVGRITPAGVIDHFNVPPCCAGSVRIAVGGDGGIWVSFNQGQSLARFSTDGTATIHPVGRPVSAVAAGPGAAVWFATEFNNEIGRILGDGRVETILLNSEVWFADALVAGSDGNLWATLEDPGFVCIPIGECPPPPTPLSIARVNLAAVVHGTTDVPALSPLMLGVLAIVLGGAAWLVLGARGGS